MGKPPPKSVRLLYIEIIYNRFMELPPLPPTNTQTYKSFILTESIQLSMHGGRAITFPQMHVQPPQFAQSPFEWPIYCKYGLNKREDDVCQTYIYVDNNYSIS